jgi:hypothetical protein
MGRDASWRVKGTTSTRRTSLARWWSSSPEISRHHRRHTYRSTVASRGGEFMLPISAQNRVSAGVATGDEVDTAETRQRRIDKSVGIQREGRAH